MSGCTDHRPVTPALPPGSDIRDQRHDTAGATPLNYIMRTLIAALALLPTLALADVAGPAKVIATPG